MNHYVFNLRKMIIPYSLVKTGRQMAFNGIKFNVSDIDSNTDSCFI